MTNPALPADLADVRLRWADASDLPVLAPLFDAYRQFYEQASDLALATAFLQERLAQQESVILLAEHHDGTGLGFIQMYSSFCSLLAAPILVLSDLFVDPRARRQGLGRALMLTAQDYAARHGYARLDLTTARSNQRAQSLYQALGWQLDSVYLAYNYSPPSQADNISG